MAGYTKLFSSIVTSTIWCEDYPTRLVWVAMLAMADARGKVEGSVPGFARLANVTMAEMEKALAIFLAPDPHSRTPDNDGRRIEVIAGGWRVLNYAAYRESRDPDVRREQNREAQARHRAASAKVSQESAQAEGEAEAVPPPSPKTGDGCPQGDTPGQEKVTTNLQDARQGPALAQEVPLPGLGAQGHPEAQERPSPAVSKRFVKPTPHEVEAYAAEIGYVRPNLGPAFCDHYEAGGWKIGTKPMKDWRAAVRTWKHRDAQGGQRGPTGPAKRITGTAGHQPGKYSHL